MAQETGFNPERLDQDFEQVFNRRYKNFRAEVEGDSVVIAAVSALNCPTDDDKVNELLKDAEQAIQQIRRPLRRVNKPSTERKQQAQNSPSSGISKLAGASSPSNQILANALRRNAGRKRSTDCAPDASVCVLLSSEFLYNLLFVFGPCDGLSMQSFFTSLEQFLRKNKVVLILKPSV